jgi:hypothetical protein
MDAKPVLHQIAAALQECHLEAILIGNAAAALQGAPVTTLDFDFMFRKTPLNLKKLKLLAACLHGQLLKPFYPASGLYRLMVDEKGLQLDFMPTIHGIRSFASLRSRATQVSFGKYALLVADLNDIIRSKKALGRPKDKAVLGLRRFYVKKGNRTKRSERLNALRKESDLALRQQIRHLLSKPMNKRTHFLRVRLPHGGSTL